MIRGPKPNLYFTVKITLRVILSQILKTIEIVKKLNKKYFQYTYVQVYALQFEQSM